LVSENPYKDTSTKTTVMTTRHLQQVDEVKGDKRQREELIKNTLINCIKLKMKLKKQIVCLKEYPPIDEKTILEHLQLS
jgi:hypothetical protein